MKKASAPLILQPPKVTGYEKKYMESKREPDSSEKAELEEETTETDDEAKTEDIPESPIKEKDLTLAAKESACLQLQPDDPFEEKRAAEKNSGRQGQFYYQPKNAAGSFFYIETNDEEDDSLEQPVRDEEAIKANLAEAEPSHDSSAIEEKAYAIETFWDDKPSDIGSQEETELAFDDGGFTEKAEDDLEEAISREAIVNRENQKVCHGSSAFESDAFTSGETFADDLSAVDLYEENEWTLDDQDFIEKAEGRLEDSLSAEYSITQDFENDEPSLDSHQLQEEEGISEESFEDLSAVDSPEDGKDGFDGRQPHEEANNSLKGWNQNEDESLYDHSFIQEEKASCKTEHLQREHKEEKHPGSRTKTKLLDNELRKLPSTIVKLPVLLAAATIDLDIFDSFDLEVPISSVTNIDWSVHCLEGHVLLPSSTIFLKGILAANVNYVSESSTHSMRTMKIQVPWKKTTKVDWLSSPLMPSKWHEDYMFQRSGEMNPSFHREYHEQFAEQIQFELKSISQVWTEELISHAGVSTLHIQGSASLSIDLLQPQYIDLSLM